MRLKSVCALAALTLAAVTATTTRAASMSFDAWSPGYGSNGPITADLNARTMHVAGGKFYDSDSADFKWEVGKYKFDADLAIDPDTITIDPAVGDPDDWEHYTPEVEHATYTGQWKLYFNGGPAWTGDVTVQGTTDAFGPFGRIYFTNGLITHTGGTGDSPFAGASNLSFSGLLVQSEALEFYGDLSNVAPAAVPLPASATMGLGLIGLLGATQFARRRSHTA